MAAAPAAPGRRRGAPVAVILRSRTERLRFLRHASRRASSWRRSSGCLVAVLLSYAVARTVTRPLAAITAAMREMTATGDLTRKIRAGPRLGRRGRARSSPRTFNTLTDSIARFQREAALRERLSALGRLSTVIAHEVRNPLMIIKASLRTLRGARASPPTSSARRPPTSTTRWRASTASWTTSWTSRGRCASSAPRPT